MNDKIKVRLKDDKNEKLTIKIRDKKPVIKIRETPTFLQIIHNKYKIMEQLAKMVKSGTDFKIVENRFVKENFIWFAEYYTNHEFSKFKNLGIGDIVNKLICNMIYVLDYLRTFDSKVVDRTDFVNLRWRYNRNSKFEETYTAPNGRHIVIKDGAIIDRCNKIEYNDKYKKSQILIEYQKSLYKAISYKTYKKLSKLKYVQVNVDCKHYIDMDDSYDSMYYNEMTFKTIEDIIGYFYGDYGYVNAGANYYAFVENTLIEYEVECEYMFKGDDKKYKCEVDEFLKDFLPDIN